MNMKHALEKKWFKVLDAAITVLLFLLSTYAGRQHLDSLNHGRSSVTSIEMLYGPAVMLASGRGFYQPDLNASPALRAFLRNERETLSPEELPEVLPEEPNSVSSYHRDLLYTVALFWRVLGISWTNLEPLCAILLGVCAVAVYGILRLGMGRLLSALLTLFFVLSPQMLTMLPSLRDFSKAPFILLLIFLLGLLIKYRFGMKALAGISVLLGLVNGIAMGFRQDALVFILPACVIVTVSVFRYERPFLKRRLLAPVLLLAAFFAAGHPMLGRMEGGAQPYHPLVQGFSMKRFASLGLEPGAYEPLASGSDNYTFAMLQDYYGRVNEEADTDFGFNSPGAETAGRQFLLDMALRFPGDLLARGYGALLRTLRYTDGVPLWHITGSPWQDRFEAYHEALKHHLHRYGPAYAVPAMLLISGNSLPLAFGLFVFVLYTCGYVSLQCEFRHAFHLSFVPLWILGFLLHCLISGVLGLRKGFPRERVAWMVPVKRAVLFAVVAAVMMLVPLYGLRFYQRYRVMPFLETIAAAERRPVSLHRHTEIEWERFALEVPEAPVPAVAPPAPDTDVEALCAILAAFIRAAYMEDGYPAWHTQTRYYALEFSPEADPKWLMLLYESAVPMNNFSQLIRIHLPRTKAASVFYFFPVYELKMPVEGGPVRNRFLGVALPKAHADGFRGLYELPDIGHIRFLPHAALPLPEGLMAGTQYRITLRPDPLDAFRADDESIATLDMADAAVRFGREREAVLLYAAALLVNKNPVQRLYIAKALMELGDHDAAAEVILDALEDPAGEKAFAVSLLGSLAGRLMERGEPEALERTLGALRALWLEKDPGLLLNVVDVLAEAGHGTAFLDQCRHILQAHPESQTAADFVEARVPGENVMAELAGFWRQVAEARPGSIQPFLRLGLANEALGDVQAAQQAYAAAYANDPSNPEAALRHAALLLASGETVGGLELVRQAVRTQPAYQDLAAQVLEPSGDRLSSTGHQEAAAEVYGLAMEYAPSNRTLQRKRAQALVEAGQTAQAEELLLDLLDGEERADAVALLDRLWKEQGTGEKRLASWQQVARRYPQDALVRRMLAEALFSLGRYAETVALLEDGTVEGEAGSEAEVLLAVARFAAGQRSQEQLAGDAHRAAVPELKAYAGALLQEAASYMESLSRPEEGSRLTGAAIFFLPESDKSLLDLAAAREKNGAFEEALHLYQQGYPAMPGADRPQVAGRLDALYERLHRPEERLHFWREATQRNTGDPTALFHLGLACEANGRWQEAIETYQAVTEPEPLKHQADLRRGVLTVRFGDADQGVPLIQAAVAADPTLTALGAMLCLQGGAELLLSGQLEPAMKSTRLAAAYAPEDPFISLQLGDVHHARNTSREAVEAWRRALVQDIAGIAGAEAGRRLDAALPVNERLELWNEMRSNHPEALLPRARYALALAAKGDLDAALGLCRTLADAAQENSEVQVACALVSCFAGQVEAGLAQLNRALERAPALAGPIVTDLADLGLQKLESGRPEEAEPLLRKAIELGPDNLLYYVYLGRALLARGAYEEAAAQFRKVLLHVPESPNAARLLDEAWAGLKDPEKQRQDWSAIVKAHPDAKIPREHLERCR